MPVSCGSYLRMNDDKSFLSTACERWGYENGNFRVGKWGGDFRPPVGHPENRLFYHVAFVEYRFHWLLGSVWDRWECDDYKVGVSSGDFWKVFVR